jgi:hypothetical protein
MIAVMKGTLLLCALAFLAVPSRGQDFWAHWGDGKAELNGYRLTQPRYGAARSGTAVYVFVTEDFSDSLRVKADPGKHPPAEVYPVMKLNAVRDFQTGIYDYNVMTSVFLRVAAGWPVAKVSFSSQEWCGNVYHQLLPRAGRISSDLHSYFDGEADRIADLPLPADGLIEDALPILVRGWNGELLRPGESRSVPFLPSLLRSRLMHRPVAWTKVLLTRSDKAAPVTVPAGRFDAFTYRAAVEGGGELVFDVEAASPRRLLRFAGPNGEEGLLLGSTRLAYWKLNQPGGEKYLKELGLPLPALAPAPAR